MPCCSPAAEAPAGEQAREALLADLRGRAFGPGAPGARRIGAEVELIPVRADTGAPVPLADAEGQGSLALLREHGPREGWVEERGPHGCPVFRPPQGGVVSFEPGGQIEYGSAPCSTVGGLVEALHRVVLPLRRAALDRGIRLLAVGIDPLNPVERVPLQLRAPRYLRMAEHLAGVGPAGARMMRQTASLQVCLDWEDEPGARWRLLNRAAPVLLAAFAGSRRYEGRDTGAASYRARVWRAVDPQRTGLPTEGADPAEEYLEFALRAPDILRPGPDGTALPFGEWLARGDWSAAGWAAHLSTLFPEVRPRGFAELRSLDAVEPEWYAAPLSVLAGLVYSPRASAAALDLLGPPEPGLLERAGEAGLRDPEIARLAAALLEISLRGAASLPCLVDGATLERAREFFERFTRRGRCPGDEPEGGRDLPRSATPVIGHQSSAPERPMTDDR